MKFIVLILVLTSLAACETGMSLNTPSAEDGQDGGTDKGFIFGEDETFTGTSENYRMEITFPSAMPKMTVRSENHTLEVRRDKK